MLSHFSSCTLHHISMNIKYMFPCDLMQLVAGWPIIKVQTAKGPVSNSFSIFFFFLIFFPAGFKGFQTPTTIFFFKKKNLRPLCGSQTWLSKIVRLYLFFFGHTHAPGKRGLRRALPYGSNSRTSTKQIC